MVISVSIEQPAESIKLTKYCPANTVTQESIGYLMPLFNWNVYLLPVPPVKKLTEIHVSPPLQSGSGVGFSAPFKACEAVRV